MNLEKNRNTISELVVHLKNGDRFALARALTIIESNKQNDREKAMKIIESCWQHNSDSWRLGITGPPGVGKSTFIDALGSFALTKGKKIAILTIDPSSSISFGSILGDKTRMETISKHPDVFIRPSPNQSKLGGIQERTAESIILCEAAGFDFIIVETVGVGQSEIEVRQLVDCMTILLLPNSGDELQGIKRGIMELADIFIVHKAEEDNKQQVKLSINQLKNAIHIQRQKQSTWIAPVLKISSLNKTGIQDYYTHLINYFDYIKNNDYKANTRAKQYVNQIDTYINNMISIHYKSLISDKVTSLNSEIIEGINSPLTIADRLFKEAIKK